MSKFYRIILGGLILFSFNSNAQIFDCGFEFPILSPSSVMNGSNGEQLISVEGDAIFKVTFDTAFGGFWSRDFALSNMMDTITGDYTNLYSSISGSGHNSSAQYLVATQNWEGGARVEMNFSNSLHSFYVNNTTYAYKSMKNGDAFAKKFGGISGDDPDFFY